jgi:hypothetical protein
MNEFERRVRRRAELTNFLGAKLDVVLAQEAAQEKARMACRAIGYHLDRAVQHAAWVRVGVTPDAGISL